MKHFIVEKTNDLHSESLVEENSIKLNRRVAKMRILLKKEPQGSEDFYQDLNDGIGISAHLQAEAGHEFCYGLDVCGEPCYGESTIAYMKYGAFTWPRYQAASDGNEYMLAMRDARQFASYYFMDPKKDVPVTVSNVEVSGTQGLPIFECLDYIRTITLKYNHITGIAFKSNSNDSWNGGMRLGMELITESDGISPVDASEIFSNNHDYKSK